MASIARGEQNTSELIRWILSEGGHHVAATEMAFQIWDFSADLPVQVFPLSGWMDLVGTPGNPSTGLYFAYDPAVPGGWTPGVTESLGRHRIRWKWRTEPSGPEGTGQQDFEVLPEGYGTANQYTLLQDVRDAGMDADTAGDQKVLAAIRTWEDVLNRVCRQWFSPRRLSFRMDGQEGDTLFLPVPVIALDMLMINDDTAATDPVLYAVYSGCDGVQDHRRNPRIALKNDAGDIYAGTLGFRTNFLAGRMNQYLSGAFGFVDQGNLTPEPIRRAALKLVIEKLQAPVYAPPGTPMPIPPVLGAVKEEWTDGHKLTYATAGGDVGSRRSGLTGITQDPEVLDIMMMYRNPKSIAVPADWWR